MTDIPIREVSVGKDFELIVEIIGQYAERLGLS